MEKLMEKKPLLHAILWIVIYIVLFNIGENLKEAAGFAFFTAVVLLALAAALAVYIGHGGRAAFYGIRPITGREARRVLYYLPLIPLALVQLAARFNPALTGEDVAVACLLMAAVGFIEEVLFRGFLFQAIRGRRGVAAAVVISGVTFGIGHIVNLLRGFTGPEEAAQVVIAVVIGILLGLLVAVSGNILPGVLFHIVFNITGTAANAKGATVLPLAIVILAISVCYTLYLVIFMQRKKEAA